MRSATSASFHHIETQKRAVRDLPRAWNESPFPRTTSPRAKTTEAAKPEAAKVAAATPQTASSAVAAVDRVEAKPPVQLSSVQTGSRFKRIHDGVAMGGAFGSAVGMVVAVGGMIAQSAEIALAGGLLPIIAVTLGGIIAGSTPTRGVGPR